MFNETLLTLLQSISDTRGFIMFCLVIALAYVSIWTLFLFEPAPKKKKPKRAEGGTGGEEGDEEPADQKQAA